MRINILQHTPNEGPELSEIGLPSITMNYIFIILILMAVSFPMLKKQIYFIILGGPMSPNNEDKWILKKEN